ncbi:MAG: DUF4142 domain-containing protein [Micromonosporaceae bacterium]
MRNIRNPRWLVAVAYGAAIATASGCGSAQAVQSPATAAHVSNQDRRWIEQDHTANMAETDTGKLATMDGATPAVRSVGSVLDRDHTASDAALIKLAGRLKIALATSETVRQTEAYGRLADESGRLFDYDFIGTMLAAHQSMISATRWEISHGSSPDVISLARQTLPALLKHLKLLQAAAPKG